MKVDRLVKRSLRLLKVIDVKQSVKAADMQTAIEVLNEMMARFEADGVSVGWSDVENPSDDVPLERENTAMASYNLALELQPEYGVEAEQMVIMRAAELLASAYRDVLNANPVMNESTGPQPNAGWSGYNAYYDGYGW